MNLVEYIDKGGIIVYILIFLNVIGFTIILWKFLTIPRKNAMIKNIKSKLDLTNRSTLEIQIEYEIKKLESGLTYIKNIASVAPLLGLLGTVYGVFKAFEEITQKGLGDPTIFSGGISVALITTIAGLIVAIPHLFAYNYFISTIDTIELKAKKELLEK
ncbi:MotA/TolQ/ExbB proton channel family protein [Halarcobacter ebronensis]|uniref:Biopolymer transporter ExbB n=1 Tax=Halarcobacter ebronensis TaxID=1462615 RepID=A0A4Q1ALU6_9BACT|nr:MotA/TolQ/ExbB proton channel family protein [Halarcobacter ebronensis]QKF81053.1 TonB system transport protein ExbB [Halarcobacter ebronensis]RXK06361.1 biopolymer transporter ExbB [Halarcobacter ebronensis]